ncbi:MAG: hypothetical protein ACPHK8_02890, partial [Thermoplasmatota archaeon]
MRVSVVAAFAGAAFCVAGIVVSLVLLDIPLNLFIAIPSAIIGGLYVFFTLFKPKQEKQGFRVTEV